MTAWRILVAVAVLLAPVAAGAAPAGKIVIAQGVDPTTLDMANQSESPASNVGRHILDTLYERDQNMKIVPLLATEMPKFALFFTMKEVALSVPVAERSTPSPEPLLTVVPLAVSVPLEMSMPVIELVSARLLLSVVATPEADAKLIPVWKPMMFAALIEPWPVTLMPFAMGPVRSTVSTVTPVPAIKTAEAGKVPPM